MPAAARHIDHAILAELAATGPLTAAEAGARLGVSRQRAARALELMRRRLLVTIAAYRLPPGHRGRAMKRATPVYAAGESADA
ncbi:MAG TPA: helix-turn-helix domain-containing protein [Alphaproteobacteria bacterium]